MSKGRTKFSRLGVLAPAALSACIDVSVLAAPAAGAILTTVLKELSKAFMLKKWYHGVMSSQEAEELLLQKGKHGSYLVRESRAHPGEFVLSVRMRTRVSHVKIRSQQNKYDVGSGEMFDDLAGLIEHCRAYPLMVASGEVLRLRQPVSGTRTRTKHAADKSHSKNPLVKQGDPMDPKQIPQMIKIINGLEVNGQQEDASWTPEDDRVPLIYVLNEYYDEYLTLLEIDQYMDVTTTVGRDSSNTYKNRYHNIVPFDHTRVHLPRTIFSLDENYNDYINASYVRPFWMLEKVFDVVTWEPEAVTVHNADWQSLINKEADPKGDMSCEEEETRIRRDHQNSVGVVNDKFYIATQGCLATTRHAFWAMLADNDVRVIVMLTECIEGGKEKCDKYWPDFGESETMEDIKVMNVGEYTHPAYVLRELTLNVGSKRTTVYQYQFRTWLDRGVPKGMINLRKYIRDVNARMKAVASEKSAPKHNILCVHCSAGVGRTGTFIAIDMLMDIMRTEGPTKFYMKDEVQNTVSLIRAQRPGMVQNVIQYEYIYKVLKDFKHGDNNDQKEEKGPYVSF